MTITNRKPSIFLAAWVALSTAVLLGSTGCSRPAAEPASAPADQAAAHGDQEHGHAEEGPHHGHLIVLGNEEYHAELVHDDSTKTVTIYLLDSAAKNNAPTSASEIRINLIVSESPKQFVLPAAPQENDPAGQSSRFELADATLCDGFDAEGATCRLSVEIDGKPYAGTLDLHEHGDHEHP